MCIYNTSLKAGVTQRILCTKLTGEAFTAMLNQDENLRCTEMMVGYIVKQVITYFASCSAGHHPHPLIYTRVQIEKKKPAAVGDPPCPIESLLLDFFTQC